jgi:hypothetical protein
VPKKLQSITGFQKLRPLLPPLSNLNSPTQPKPTKNMNNAIILNGSGYTLDITPTAKTLKAEAVESAKRITAVADADSCNLAQAKIKALAGLRTGVEASRKAEEAAKAVQAPAEAPAPAPKGVSEVIDFEVTDLQAFHAKFPQLCTVTVNRAAVLAALQKSLAKKGTLPEVVGLRVFQNLRIGRRAL